MAAVQVPPQYSRRCRMSITNTKGLTNHPGENNCFLNSAVQVLWHLDVFRRSFREITGHTCLGHSCIVCALKMLFTQFQYSSQTVLPPDSLRKALAETFQDQQRFQLGLMDDAAECFENMLQRLHFHIAHSEPEDNCTAEYCISHQKFSMRISEQSICGRCGAATELPPYSQMVHYVSATALAAESRVIERTDDTSLERFGRLLRRAGAMGDFRNCPANCGERNRIRRNLLNCPDIISIGLAWESEKPKPHHIQEVVQAIGACIRLPDIFSSVLDERWKASPMLNLVGIVSYYGKHYSTFFYHTSRDMWIYFDDARVREIGSWENVVDKCCRGNYQPLLLLYANPHGLPVAVDAAPSHITMVPGCRPFSPGFKDNLHLSQKMPNGLMKDFARPVTPSSLHNGETGSKHLSNGDAVDYNNYRAEGSYRLDDTLNKTDDSLEAIMRHSLQDYSSCSSEQSWSGQITGPVEDFEYTLSNNNHYRNNAAKASSSPLRKPVSHVHTNQIKRGESLRGGRDRLSTDIIRCHAGGSGSNTSQPGHFATDGSIINQITDPAVAKVMHTSASYNNILNAASSDCNLINGYTTLPHNKSLTSSSTCNGYDLTSNGFSAPETHGQCNSIENSYIDRRTVESVLNMQKHFQKSSSPVTGTPGSRSSNSSIESFAEQAARRRYQGELKVDIPEAIVMAHRRDSGYKSGDRNSASSTSSSTESPPAAENQAKSMNALLNWFQHNKGIPERRHNSDHTVMNLTAPVRAIHYDFKDSRLHGSTESFASMSSNASFKKSPNKLLHQDDTNSLTSLESLSSSQCSATSFTHNTQPNKLQKVVENQTLKQEEITSHQSTECDLTLDQSMEHQMTDFSNPDPITKAVIVGCKNPCESLCLEADSLLEQSRIRETYGDLKTALALCTAASSCVQQALEVSAPDAESLEHARVKYDTISLHLTTLYQRINPQQQQQHAMINNRNYGMKSSSQVVEESRAPMSAYNFPAASSFASCHYTPSPITTTTVATTGLPYSLPLPEVNHSRQSSIQSNSSVSSVSTVTGPVSGVQPTTSKTPQMSVRKPSAVELMKILKARDKNKLRSSQGERSRNQSLPDLRAGLSDANLESGNCGAETMFASSTSLNSLGGGTDVCLSSLPSDGSQPLAAQRLGLLINDDSYVDSLSASASGSRTSDKLSASDGSLASRINSINAEYTDLEPKQLSSQENEGIYSVRFGTTLNRSASFSGQGDNEQKESPSPSKPSESVDNVKKQLELLYSSRLRELDLQEKQKAEIAKRKLNLSSSNLEEYNRIQNRETDKPWTESDTCSVQSEPVRTNNDDSSGFTVGLERTFVKPAFVNINEDEVDENSTKLNVKELARRFELVRTSSADTEGMRTVLNETDNKRISNYCTLPRKREKQPSTSQADGVRRVTFCEEPAEICVDMNETGVPIPKTASPPKPALKMPNKNRTNGVQEFPMPEEGIRTVPCHLCRVKHIVPPALYCSDCDFYMSRFKPKI